MSMTWRSGSLGGACAIVLGGCAALHDWSTRPPPDAGRDATAVCTELCDGVCTNTASDVAHCGACGVDCRALPHVLVGAERVRCEAGRCLIPATACEPGWADCTAPGDGCETDLASPTSCGNCATRCPVSLPLCDASLGRCTDACPDGRALCGATCVDPAGDPRNCGGCGLGCAAIPGSVATCVDGLCSYDCLPGHHDCGTACGRDDSPLTCGSACVPCSGSENADPICPRGMCETTCAAGFHACSGVCVANGDPRTCGTSCTACPAPPGAVGTCDGVRCGIACQAGAHLCGDACLPDADPASCGDACAPCPTPPNTRATCDGARCGTTCRTTHADCNGSGDGGDADGCETDLATAEDCGACGAACGLGAALCAATGTGYACVTGCAAGQTACVDACVDLATDPQSCGACGVACPVPVSGTATCSAGLCGVRCDPGFHPCGGACIADTSTSGCGTSCTACPAPLRATATCDGVRCGWQCDPGFHACGDTCVDDRSVESCGSTCTPCPTAASGTATCDGARCGLACDPGFHRCGALCVADVSAASCGTSCTPCPLPANGSATCDGARCGVACEPGFHRCGDRCVADTSAANCGAACTPCVPPANAEATCDGTGCGFRCNAGFHRCGSACVSDTSLATCGTSCTPCVDPPNAFATCGGTRCGFRCVPGFADCDGVATNGCEADLSTAATCGACTRRCAGSTPTCAAGTCTAGCSDPSLVACDGACVDTGSDPASCGACGVMCAAPASARATCDSGICGVVCDPGFHACGGACLSDDSPAACGTACTPCAAPTGGSATCVDGACGFVCDVGFHACGSSCAPDDSVTACGPTCARCTAPASGVPACVGGACTFSCVSGTHRCGDRCASDASPNSCGTRCAPCTAPANARATCEAGACGFVCDAGYVRVGAACVAIPAPRPVSPISTSCVTSRSPTLVWALAPGTDGARVEVCAERECATVVRSVDVVGTSTAVNPALLPGVWFWRLTGRIGASLGVQTSPVLEVVVPARSAPRTTVWGVITDPSGDGYADLVTGAPGAGAAFVHRGGPIGLSATPFATLTGPVSLGSALEAAGDVDGDGFGDVVVGAPDANLARVYYGGASGLGARAPTEFGSGASTFGHAVAAAGDVDGDGYGDVIVGAPAASRAYVFRGAAGGLAATATWVLTGSADSFGQSVAGAGDVDGDGYADVVIGDPGAGRVLLYRGGTAGLGAMPTAAVTLRGDEGFGATVAGAGDVDGDGHADVVVGEPGARRAYVYRGRPGGLDPSGVTLMAGSAEFGDAVAAAGDVDGDGFGDVLVGSERERRAWVFRGASGGITRSALVTLAAPSTSERRFGASVASPGDVNGDGESDLLVGAPGSTRVYLFLGTAGTGPTATATLALVGPAGSSYGEAVATLLSRRRRLRLRGRRATRAET